MRHLNGVLQCPRGDVAGDVAVPADSARQSEPSRPGDPSHTPLRPGVPTAWRPTPATPT